MNHKKENNELFHTSPMIVLIAYTIFDVMQIIITFLLGWDKWTLFVVLAALAASWIVHIFSILSEYQRLWFDAFCIMITYFIYGSHVTSTFDLAIVMATLMISFTMTGIKGLINFGQICYYIVLTYDIVQMIMNDTKFDMVLICRVAMSYSVIAMFAWFAKTIIDKWNQVIESSNTEIEKLTDSTERLNDFLSNVSHELRTPINAVIGLSEICIDKEENPEIKNSLSEIHTAGHKVADQISDILDYSEIDRGNVVNNAEDYMISSVMNDLMNDLRKFRKNNVELVVDVTPNVPAVMNTDVVKLKKIIKALVSNGIKYTNEGGVYLKIDSEKKPYGVNLSIIVSDTGIGMTDDELERVYERFYQSDSGRSRSSGGLGLGLGIVSGFVSVMGGFMTISSRSGVGTTVRVSIPQKVIDNSECMSVKNKSEKIVGSFINFDNFNSPMVREYYNNLQESIGKGLGVELHRVESIEKLKKLTESVKLTHIFVGEPEYKANIDLVEKLSEKMVVVVVADRMFELPHDSGARIMLKPFYCFPIISMLNSNIELKKSEGKRLQLKGVTALIVDDEPMNIVVAKSIFKRYEIEVSSVNSGKDSIQICRERRFDLIFMDHMMSGMDGVEAMKKIRSDVKGLNHDVPMVALTANAMSSAKQMFLSEGFDGFISKPIEIQELERVLKKLVPDNMISYVYEEDIKKKSSESKPSQGEASDEVFEFGSGEASEEVFEFGAGEASDEVFEFGAGEASDEVFEFGSGETSEAGKAATEQEPAIEQVSTSVIKSKLKEIGINTESGLEYCSDDEDLYNMLVIQFAEEMDERITNLESFFSEEDWKNYEIVIHSTKSTSKMIGALELSDDALKLENAANEKNGEYIKQNHERVMSVCRYIGDKIFEIYGRGVKKTEEVVSESASKDDDEGVFEFNPQDSDEVFEFGPQDSDEVFEFGPAAEDT